MTPIWIRLLMRMLFFWVLYHWLHFDKFFGLVNILNPEQGREGTSSWYCNPFNLGAEIRD